MTDVTGAVTTRFAPPKGKKFTWSYSKLKNSEICLKRHFEIDIAKKVKDTGGENLIWGNLVHDSMHKRLSQKVSLPPEMIDYEMFAKRIEDKASMLGGQILVEQKYAINQDFGATGYFAPDVWYRGIGDVVVLAGNVALVGDWKTGKIIEDSVQLFLMAQCIFSFYPAVQRVAAKFIWLKEHAETDEVFSRSDMVRLWPPLLERVKKLQTAAETMDYPPKPGGLCKKYCPVTSCPYHGKGSPP